MRHTQRRTPVLYLAVLGLAAEPAWAQFNVQWLRFEKDPARLVSDVPLTDLNTQSHLSWGDLDQDGWTDVVVMRKQNVTTAGKRPNILLRNEEGVLVNRTPEYASQSLGDATDQGFLTPTNDRASVTVDVNGDGWLDVVTAVTTSDGDPKHIGHPRVYVNLGEDGSGNWLGLRFEDVRFPQLFQFDSGLPQNPRFCDVSAGDLNNDGSADLYFVDHDLSLSGGGASQPPGADMNDRMLFNDGNGYFADVSQASMTAQMLLSSYGVSSRIADLNGNGHQDVIKVTTGWIPTYVAASYNRPDLPGVFAEFQPMAFNQPYYVDVGDLNNDGRLDVVAVTDFGDRFVGNTGTDPLGKVTWGPVQSVETLVSEFKWGGEIRMADLDGDGWNDVIVTDVDVDLPVYTGRTNIYQNLSEVPGGAIKLREQRETSSSNGWLGAVGLYVGDLGATHDVAVLDIDNDGDLDLLISRRSGNMVWLNQTNPVVCQADLGSGGPGNSFLSLCGPPLWAGNSATLSLQGAPAGAPAVLVVGPGQAALPILGGTIVPDPVIVLPQVFTADGAGQIALPVLGNGLNATVVLQGVVLDFSHPDAFQITNALSVQFQG